MSSSQRALLAISGGILMAIGLVLFLVTNEAANACSSGLIAALDPTTCNDYTLAHDAGIVSGIVGLVCVIVAIVKS